MDERIERPAPWMPWAMTSVMLVVVALGAYSFGAYRQAMSLGTSDGVQVWRHDPFSGIFTLFLFFWIFGAFRWMAWGGCRRPWRGRRYYRADWPADRDDFEDWHRREHERMGARGPAPRSGAGPAEV